MVDSENSPKNYKKINNKYWDNNKKTQECENLFLIILRLKNV